MSNSFIGLPAPGIIDKRLDAELVDSTGVLRQRSQWAGVLISEIARVLNADPGASDYGGVVRPIEVGAVIRHGNKSGIINTPVQIVASATPTPRGVTVYADPSNEDDVWVGSSTVTPGTVDATDGKRLRAATSEFVFVRIDDASKVYVRTPAGPIGTARVAWIGA